MRPTMVLPSTALFGSSFGSLFLKTLSNSNASLLLILVLAFVVTYSIGYLFMRRSEIADVAISEARSVTEPTAEETKPLLEDFERASGASSESDLEDCE